MLEIGLTGGIGSGKSTVAAKLVDRGASLLDADALILETFTSLLHIAAILEVLQEIRDAPPAIVHMALHQRGGEWDQDPQLYAKTAAALGAHARVLAQAHQADGARRQPDHRVARRGPPAARATTPYTRTSWSPPPTPPTWRGPR